jgi:hypothetical protein
MAAVRIADQRQLEPEVEQHAPDLDRKGGKGVKGEDDVGRRRAQDVEHPVVRRQQPPQPRDALVVVVGDGDLGSDDIEPSGPQPRADRRRGRDPIADRVAGRRAAGGPHLLYRDGVSVEIEDPPHARLNARHVQARSAGCGL